MAEHGDGMFPCLQCGLMSRGIDAQCQSREHRSPLFGQSGREFSSPLEPCFTWLARSDDGNCASI